MSELSNNNVLSYPTMTRQRADKIQAKEIAYAEDVNAEFDHIVDVYNRLVALLTGEWGDDTGRIYDLVDNAVSLANEALAKANDCVQKSGDTMTGHLNISLVPTSDYNVVNKKYVDDTIDAELSDPINRIGELENFRDNLNASQVKLENANFSSTNVNDGMNELFISVSNGKKTVADAITGKGVATSGDASFKQMADNINAILTFNEGTSGGTATAEDIMYGKTAYARNTLIVGTYVPIDLSDATATSDKIIEGYTAYVGGGKIIGTYVPPREYPIYGTDTSDATAYAEDIAYGKVAYARGQRLVGTLANTDVEEIYGIDAGAYKSEIISSMQEDPITKEKYIVDKIAYAKDLSYVVRMTHKDGDTNNYYLESYAINDKGYYIQQSSGINGNIVTKKYRYTLSDLEIPADETIKAIALGARGLYGVSNLCRLLVFTIKKVKRQDEEVYDYYGYLRTYTYHLYDNGVIGKMIDSEYVEDNSYSIDDSPIVDSSGVSAYDYVIVTSNLDKDRCMVIKAGGVTSSGSSVTIYSCNIFIDYILKTKTTKSIYGVGIRDTNLLNYKLSPDDRYLYYAGYTDISIDNPFIIKIDTENEYVIEDIKAGINNTFTYNYINGTDLFIQSTRGDNGNYDSDLIFTNMDKIATTTGLKKILTPDDDSKKINYALATKDYVLAFREDGYMYIYKFDVVSINDGESVSAIAKVYVGGYEVQEYLDDLALIFVNDIAGDLKRVSTELDKENIIGVKYKEQYFYNKNISGLTATTQDVIKGKTFIGAKGTPETGIMEV